MLSEATLPRQRFPVRLVNSIAPMMIRAGMLPQSLEKESLIDVATRRMALNDFGNPHFWEPLSLLTDDLHNATDIHKTGRFFYRKYLLNFLKNRLLFIDEVKRNPWILEQPVPRPLIIIGLPRTGTSRLFNIMARDPSNRTLSFWEANRPVPPPTEKSYHRDWRRIPGWLFINIAAHLAPTFPAIHELRLDGPEECIHLLCNSFTSWLFSFQYNAPHYQKWFATCDHDQAYREHKMQLQILQSKFKRERWLLKSPAHLMGLDSLLKTYPDACIIQTHRDPVKVVPSTCSLAKTTRGIVSTQIKLDDIGAQVVSQLAPALEHTVEVRERLGSKQFIDIQYNDIVADPMAVIEKIYAYFDLPLTQDARYQMSLEVDASPQHKHGRHVYGPEEFGLTEAGLEARFKTYCDAFDIPRER